MLYKYFEEVAKAYSKKVAIKFEEKEMDYSLLLSTIDTFSAKLVSIGIKKNDKIIVSCKQDLMLVPVILSINKIGATYVPVDPEYPAERREYIINDCQAKLIISEKNINTNISNITVQDLYNSDKRKTKVENSDVAYVIYTSGTTGDPKGVEIPPNNLLALYKSTKKLFDLSEDDIWTMFHSYSFDFSVWEMWGALLSGSTLVVISRNVARSFELFSKLLVKEKVTVLSQTPAAFYQLMNFSKDSDLSNLRLLIFGGDKLNLSKVISWKRKYPHQRLINMYGITETTVHVTYYELKFTELETETQYSVIGKPIPGWNISLRDEFGEIVSRGKKGEIWVSGDGVAKSYLNREELTKERFVYENSVRWYKSGDLAFELESGDLAYIGRKDSQVKIRGYRIELEEVKNKIESIPGVNHVGLIVKSHDEIDSLVAFVDLQEDICSISEIISQLKNILPHYYIPSRFIKIDKMPLTLNGKVDKKSLELIQSQEEINKSTSSSSYLNIWKEILGVNIDENDDFFESGGDSLNSMVLLNKLREFYDSDISLMELFTNSTPKSFDKMMYENKK